MKQFILIIYISLSLSVYSQNFIDENKTWSTIEIDESFSPDHMDPTLRTFYTKFIGDSIINSKTYNKLFQSSDSTLTWDFVSLLREEDHKVFIYSSNIQSDLLLYDFSCTAGDTGYVTSIINNNINIDSLSFTIDSTNIISYSGIEYKQLFVSLQTDYEQIQDIWIEGIGSTYGPLSQNCIGLIGCYMNWELLCMHLNTNLIYQNPNYNTCFITDTLTNISAIEKGTKGFNLYPNPTTDIITISLDKKIKEKVGISIYNINGTLIKSLPTNYPNKNISISTNEFLSGIYFCEVKGNNFISREKFVVVKE